MTTPARGTPDWGIPDYEASASQVDLGQVLSGLYHFDRVDQRGRVAVVETWSEGSFAWVLQAAGAAAIPDVVTNPIIVPFVPPVCLRLLPGPLATDASTAGRSIYLGESTRIGIECAFGNQNAGGDAQMKLEYRLVNGARYLMRMTYFTVQGEWKISTPTGSVLVASRPVTVASMWQQAKVIGDWSTGKFVRAVIGDSEVDLSAYDMEVSGLGEVGKCISTLRAQGNTAGGNLPVYNGYTVVTRDEP